MLDATQQTAKKAEQALDRSQRKHFSQSIPRITATSKTKHFSSATCKNRALILLLVLMGALARAGTLALCGLKTFLVMLSRRMAKMARSGSLCGNPCVTCLHQLAGAIRDSLNIIT